MNMILDFVNDVNTENVEIKRQHIRCIQKCDEKVSSTLQLPCPSILRGGAFFFLLFPS